MRIRAIPLSAAELAHLTGSPLPSVASSRQHPSYSGSGHPPANFWWLWAAGTFIPLLAGVLAGLAGLADVAVPLLAVGAAMFVTNVALALATDGYSRGDAAGLGRGIALGSGWAGLALVAVAVLFTLLVIVVSILIAAAILAALAGMSNN